MMGHIKGITVTLYEPVTAGRDAFNRELRELVPVLVENVLVAPVESSVSPKPGTTELSPKEEAYLLGIPKGDTHVWEDRDVAFFGKRFHSESFAREGIDALIPLSWNRKILVKRYG